MRDTSRVYSRLCSDGPEPACAAQPAPHADGPVVWQAVYACIPERMSSKAAARELPSPHL
jgi:hypothetical protein